MPEHTDGQFDSTAFRLTKEHCQEIWTGSKKLFRIYEEMEKLYWMDWDEESKVARQIENVKLTKSPRARIAIKGAEHLLTATDPQFSVPTDINKPATNLIGDKLERFAKAMWFASGRISGDPIHYDIVRSGLLYSDIHIEINSTKQLLEYTKGSNKAMEARAEYVAEKTPYLFNVLSPLEGVPEWGTLGLQAFYRKVKTTSGFVMDNWGSRGEAALRTDRNLPFDSISRYTTVYLNDLYDNRDRTVWLDGCERPIFQDAHGLPFIPRIAQLVEGSRGLFSDRDKQREPFLFTLYKSGIVNRQNLFLTVMYTLIFAVGANPMFVNYLLDPDNPPKVDYSKAGGQINMRVGERREPMSKVVVDPSLMQGWQIANELEQESTIYRQTLGEPLGMNAPYSMVALLSQTGRLPLVSAQRKSGWAIAEAVELAMKWLKFGKGGKATAYHEQFSAELDPKSIPEHFEIQVNLDVNLPQDQLNAANAANVLASGEDPMVSKRWVRENVLNIGQSRDMDKEIWSEKAAASQFMNYLNTMMAQAMQAAQAAQAPGASGIPGTPQMQGPPPGPPTPEQPGMVPNPQPMEPMEPMPGMLANQQPIEE